MTVDTVGWIASMTKALTGAAAMQLVEQGKLDLDAPAARIVPGIAAAQVLEGFDAGGSRARAHQNAKSRCATCSPTPPASATRSGARRSPPTRLPNIPGIITCQNAALGTPLLFDPGDKWFYGIGIDWAGKMVEAASGKRLGRLPPGRTCLRPLA